MLNRSFSKGIGEADSRERHYVQSIHEIDADCGSIYLENQSAHSGW
jgi:hypothetical protein